MSTDALAKATAFRDRRAAGRQLAAGLATYAGQPRSSRA